jgi:hypothetical protein
MTGREGVVQLASRRAYQASNRVLDEVDAALAAVRARTGVPLDSSTGAGTDRAGERADLDLAMRAATAEAAYQMSRRMTAAIRQLSLSEFLR